MLSSSCLETGNMSIIHFWGWVRYFRSGSILSWIYIGKHIYLKKKKIISSYNIYSKRLPFHLYVSRHSSVFKKLFRAWERNPSPNRNSITEITELYFRNGEHKCWKYLPARKDCFKKPDTIINKLHPFPLYSGLTDKPTLNDLASSQVR